MSHTQEVAEGREILQDVRLFMLTAGQTQENQDGWLPYRVAKPVLCGPGLPRPAPQVAEPDLWAVYC
jgi:hypothetical protein